MIRIMCKTQDTIKLGMLSPFQGNLKKRTENNIDALADSITNEGLLMPFAVWCHDGKNLLLDGHGRLAALTELSLYDNDIATQDFPVIYIEADNEEQAKKSLLQITSSYGRITRNGVLEFCASIPTYVAPSISKYVREVPKKRKLEAQPNEKVLRIAVAIDKLDAVRKLFEDTEFIRIL